MKRYFAFQVTTADAFEMYVSLSVTELCFKLAEALQSDQSVEMLEAGQVEAVDVASALDCVRAEEWVPNTYESKVYARV